MDGPERGKIEGGVRGARMFHLVSLSLQISPADLPGPCLGVCVGVACWVVLLLVSFFRGNLISISCYFQLLTDHVSHLSGNAGKKKGKIEGGGQMYWSNDEIDYFVLPVPLPLPSRGESRGLASDGVSLPFLLPFPFPSPRPFPFPLPLGAAPMGCGKSVS